MVSLVCRGLPLAFMVHYLLHLAIVRLHHGFVGSNIFLATSKIHVTAHGHRVVQVKSTPQNCPHRFQIFLFPCHFKIIYIDGQEELFVTMHV